MITIDLAESSAAHREQVREKLGEPYRTMLGHFRHEVGHYYEWQLVRGEDLLTRCRELFGDETADYQAEIDRHYAEGPPEGWESSYISSYATMHPFEDFAETWAHYLHICDTIETASEYGLTTVGTVTSFTSFRDVVVGIWVPLSVALNMINRSMGHDDLYPFVIPAAGARQARLRGVAGTDRVRPARFSARWWVTDRDGRVALVQPPEPGARGLARSPSCSAGPRSGRRSWHRADVGGHGCPAGLGARRGRARFEPRSSCARRRRTRRRAGPPLQLSAAGASARANPDRSHPPRPVDHTLQQTAG